VPDNAKIADTEFALCGGMVYSTKPQSGVVSTIRGSPLDATVSNSLWDECATFV
jgi:hypothetical protein